MSDEHTEPVEQAKEEADREVADLEERSEQVGERIEETRKDWQAKQADDAVPGAVGDPDDDRGTDETPDQAA
jgi:chaperonin cofactor prefoldin